MMFRLLTTEVLWNGIVKGYSIVTISSDGICIEPFEKELHSTVFIPGPIAVLNSSEFDEFVIDDIEMIIGGAEPAGYEKRLDDFFKSSGLYFRSGNNSVPVLLRLGRNCQIIPMS